MGLLWLVVGELVVLLTNLLRAELRTEGGGGGETSKRGVDDDIIKQREGER